MGAKLTASPAQLFQPTAFWLNRTKSRAASVRVISQLQEQHLALLEAGIKLGRDLRDAHRQPLPVQGHRLAAQLPSQRGGCGQSNHHRQPHRGIATAKKLVHSKSYGLSSTEVNRAKSKLFHAAG